MGHPGVGTSKVRSAFPRREVCFDLKVVAGPLVDVASCSLCLQVSSGFLSKFEAARRGAVLGSVAAEDELEKKQVCKG